jgi:hypothetical protein
VRARARLHTTRTVAFTRAGAIYTSARARLPGTDDRPARATRHRQVGRQSARRRRSIELWRWRERRRRRRRGRGSPARRERDDGVARGPRALMARGKVGVWRARPRAATLHTRRPHDDVSRRALHCACACARRWRVRSGPVQRSIGIGLPCRRALPALSIASAIQPATWRVPGFKSIGRGGIRPLVPFPRSLCTVCSGWLVLSPAGVLIFKFGPA